MSMSERKLISNGEKNLYNRICCWKLLQAPLFFDLSPFFDLHLQRFLSLLPIYRCSWFRGLLPCKSAPVRCWCYLATSRINWLPVAEKIASNFEPWQNQFFAVLPTINCCHVYLGNTDYWWQVIFIPSSYNALWRTTLSFTACSSSLNFRGFLWFLDVILKQSSSAA